MAALPHDRFQAAPPFSKAGVDCFGPIEVMYMRKRMKRYGCLFTCLVTRAVHLEVAFTLDADSFIMCLEDLLRGEVLPVLSILTMGQTSLVLNTNSESVWKDGIKKR